MFKLMTTIDVEEDAIERHLLERVQRRLWGPDFNVGDLVRFTGEARDDDDLAPGALAIVDDVLWDDGEPRYGIRYVAPQGYETCRLVAASDLRRKEGAHAAPLAS